MTERNYRPRGTGHVFAKGNTWYGEFYLRGRKVKRSLGPIRPPGSRVGLTRTMAEATLRETIAEETRAPPPVVDGQWTIADVGTRRIANLARKGRQPDTTLGNYDADIRLHFAPFFGDTPVDRIGPDDIEEFLDECLDGELRAERGQRPLAISTVGKLYTHLSGIFDFAVRKHWCNANPCREVDKPASADAEDEPEIRFLTMQELEAVLIVAGAGPCKHTPKTLKRGALARELRDIERLQWKEIASRLSCSPATAIYLYRATPEAVIEDDLARVERVLYLTAAMTGLRQGELLALRWRDIDWTAGKIRVMYGMRKKRRRKTKSRSSRRSVPMADRVAGELDGLFKASAYHGDDDLVFGHPHSGRPLDRTSVTVRFQRVCGRAGIRDDVVFHDLRHTFGTMMAGAGVPLRTLQGWMGHADSRTTQIYAHFAPAEDEVQTANRVFPHPGGDIGGDKLSATERNSTPENPDEPGVDR
jgi:integrase